MTAGPDLGIFVVSVAAGLIGALAGVGGGILVMPALTVLFGVDLRLVIGASIVSVIATSSGAAAAYVRDELSNIRIGMFLELATTSGAVAGALLAAIVAPQALYLLFGIVLLVSAALQLNRIAEELPLSPFPPRWPPVSSSPARSPTATWDAGSSANQGASHWALGSWRSRGWFRACSRSAPGP